MTVPFLFFVASVSGFAPQIVIAATAPGDLYTGSAPVASQSDEERAVALRAALTQVLVRLSGDAAIASRPDISKAVARADRYVQQFSYDVAASASPSRLTFIAQFDGNAIDGLLREANAGSSAPGTAPPTAAGAGDSAAAPGAGAGSFRLWISGLRSAEDYARLIGALNASDQVRQVRVEQAHDDGIRVRVETRAGLQDLLNMLDATRVAHVTDAAHGSMEGVDAILAFEP